MSLFDVIRYPLAFPYTKEQFESIPIDLLMRWLDTMKDWHYTNKNLGFVILWYCDRSYSPKSEKEIDVLRKMIAEYECI